MSELDKLFIKNGADKSSKGHHYYELYETVFERLKSKENVKILEVGIWKGLSIAAMREYLPNAEFYGIDIFTRVKPEEVSVLKHDNVHWIKGDSTNPEIQSKIDTDWEGVEFDVIIDDGLHTPRANAQTLYNLWKYLKFGGDYIIEDVWPIGWLSNEEMRRNPWLLKNNKIYTRQDFELFLDTVQDKVGGDKGYLDIKDFRNKSGKGDSVIYRLVKMT